MKPLISVIVPVYNVELYLRKCVDSIIRQTYTNLEIILVDDGSNDNCGAICDEYARLDKRVKIFHKPNGGLSDARNAGLDTCQGEYIGFVDSDDWIAEDMYEKLYDFVSKNDLDVASCGRNYVEGEKIIKSPSFESFVTEDKVDMIEKIIGNRRGAVGVVVWNKLYHKNVLQDIRFPFGKLYEDSYFVMKWIPKAKKFGCISDQKYYYLQRLGSITKPEKFDERCIHILEGEKENLEIIKRDYPQATECAEGSYYCSHTAVIAYILRCSDWDMHLDEINFFQSKMRKMLFKVLKNKKIGLNRKVGFVLMSIDTSLYMYAKKFYQKYLER